MSASAWSRLAAGAGAVPFLLALPRHTDPDATWWNVALWTLVAAVYFAAQFAPHRIGGEDNGGRMVGAFAGLYLPLGVASGEDYRFAHGLTDLGLRYLIFFSATAPGASLRRSGGRCSWRRCSP